jgi:ribosomal protein L12E/L44/L45/RPP1/RPP2
VNPSWVFSLNMENSGVVSRPQVLDKEKDELIFENSVKRVKKQRGSSDSEDDEDEDDDDEEDEEGDEDDEEEDDEEEDN